MNVDTGVVSLGGFAFECGRAIPRFEAAYEAYGEFTGNNAVLICHALTGSAHVAGDHRDDTGGQAQAWWDDMVGPGKPIDTDRFYVVCVNVPGSCYGTTGPGSIDPETGEPYGRSFPPVTVGDWTRAQRRVLDELGVETVCAVTGGSVGGMNVLEWVSRYPDDVELAIPVATGPRLDPQGVALDAIARRAILAGLAEAEGPPGETASYFGLGLARQIGHVMYLSKPSVAQKFGRDPAAPSREEKLFPRDPTRGHFPAFDVETYLDYKADRFVERFDPYSYLYMMNAMDHYDLARAYDDDTQAIEGFDGEALVFSFTADWHFTLEQSVGLTNSFAEAGVSVAHHVIESDYGHDAFLVEVDRYGEILAAFLRGGLANVRRPRRRVATPGEREQPTRANTVLVPNSLRNQPPQTVVERIRSAGGESIGYYTTERYTIDQHAQTQSYSEGHEDNV